MIKVARYLRHHYDLTRSPGQCRDQHRTNIARCFCSRAETARYGRSALFELRRWPQWMLGRPPRRGYSSRRQFCGVAAALLGAATHTVLIILVAAVRIAQDNGNGGDEARAY